MRYNPDINNHRTIRLKGYDYSKEGLYFITICTYNRLCLLGGTENGEMILNNAGWTVDKCWLEIPTHYPNVVLHEHVVMPNHVHGIIEIITGANAGSHVGANNHSPLPRGTSKTIGAIVCGFKIGVTKWFRKNTNIYTVWQRNYYEHIIRDEKSYDHISEYISTNPLQWQDDKYYAYQ